MALDPPLFQTPMLVIEAPNKAEFGTVLQTWTECSYEKDLFTPSDTFSFKLAITGTSGPNAPTEDYIRQMMALTVPDTVVKVVVGTDTLMTGIIGTQRISGDKTGEYVEVSGRDPASLLTDNEVDPKLKITRNTTLPDLADQILGSRYNYQRPAGGFCLWLDVSAYGGDEAATVKLFRDGGDRDHHRVFLQNRVRDSAG